MSELKPVAWLHTMHMEGGQTNRRLSLTQANVFGRPGKDYSAEYAVTIEPLFLALRPAPICNSPAPDPDIASCLAKLDDIAENGGKDGDHKVTILTSQLAALTRMAAPDPVISALKGNGEGL